MEILLLLALLAAGYVLFQRSRGVEPGSSGFGRVLTGCLGFGCLATLIVFVVSIVVLYLVFQWLADVDLSLLGLDPDSGGDQQDGPRPGSERIS
ncbi:MAG: hypothetical protein H0W09_05360 [Solirubrobacterales bacterium]|nr:hypothetical protein [Solirubrobacterales bacterium]